MIFDWFWIGSYEQKYQLHWKILSQEFDPECFTDEETYELAYHIAENHNGAQFSSAEADNDADLYRNYSNFEYGFGPGWYRIGYRF